MTRELSDPALVLSSTTMIDITRELPESESGDIPAGVRDDVHKYLFELLTRIERVQILEYIRDEHDDLVLPDRLRFAHADRDTCRKESLGDYLKGFILFHDDSDVLRLDS